MNDLKIYGKIITNLLLVCARNEWEIIETYINLNGYLAHMLELSVVLLLS